MVSVLNSDAGIEGNAGSEIQEPHLSGISLSRVEHMVPDHPILRATSAALAFETFA